MSSGRAEEEEETTSSISSLQTRIMHVDADESSSSPLLSQMPPIKSRSRRGGLSKYYQGKSQSFSSFSDLATVGDLAKKESTNSYNYMRKPFISYDHEQDHIISSTGPPPAGPSTSNSRRGHPGHGHGSGTCATTSMIARTTSGCSYFSSGKPPPPTNTYDYTHAAQQQHI